MSRGADNGRVRCQLQVSTSTTQRLPEGIRLHSPRSGVMEHVRILAVCRCRGCLRCWGHTFVSWTSIWTDPDSILSQ